MFVKRVVPLMIKKARNYVTNASLRDYQAEAIHSCTDAVDSGIKRIGVSLPTGGGKTVVFANLIDCMKQRSKKKKFRTLVLVHRRELALQARNAIEKYCPADNVEIEMSAMKADVNDSDVIVASVQSLIRRLEKYDPTDIDMIIVDEAHHCVAKTYRSILQHFNADSNDTMIPVVGFSATFERTDGKSLSEVFQKIVYHKEILDMIDNKWLCESKFTTVDVKADFSKIEGTSVGKDFDLGKLSKVMNVPEINQVILATYLEKKNEHGLKSSLLFGIDIAHLKALHEVFESNGVKSMYVTSETKKYDRESIIEDFKTGKIEVLMNCGIFTEGTDIPNIDCVLLCRPTKSRPLLVQMIGRGMRLHHSKEYCHVIDFINSSDVGVISVPSLLGMEDSSTLLDEKTLDEIKAINEAINEEMEKEKEKVEKANEELALQNMKMHDNYYKEFQEMVSKFDAMELTMTTYESLSQFCEQSNPASNESFSKMKLIEKEHKILFDSKRPWVKFQKDAWALSICNGSHVRLYKEVSKPKTDAVERRYVLKMYREIPTFEPKEQAVRFTSNDVVASKNLQEVVNKVDAIIAELQEGGSTSHANSARVDVSKFSRWRRDRPSQKQAQRVTRLLKQRFDKESWNYINISSNDIDDYVKGMSKGSASDLIFSASLAPVFPVRNLLRALDCQANMKQTTFLRM